MSPTASASASSLAPDSRPGSSLRRLGQLRANSNPQTSLSPHSNPNLNHSSSSSLRSARNPLSRSPWFSSSHSAHNDLSSVGTSLPVPCGQTDQTSFISRYRQAFFSCYRDVGVDLRASSPDSLVSVSDDSDSEDQAQGNMARLRRSRTPSETPSHTPDLSLHPESRDPTDQPGRPSSTRPRSSTYANGQPAPPDPLAEDTPVSDPPATAETSPENPPPENSPPFNPNQKPTIRFYPHQDFHRNTRPSLHFIPISRTIPSASSVIRMGRYSERDGVPVANPGGPSDAPVGFKSKVVSRRHCEFVYVNGTWHVKDVGSSSGTFLNHMRLSQPTMVSRLYPIKDGDIVQLGIDFRGGEEMIFRCVRMRIECNRAWQQRPNEFKYVDVITCSHLLSPRLTNIVKTRRASLRIWGRAKLPIILAVANARFALDQFWYAVPVSQEITANWTTETLSVSVHGGMCSCVALQMCQSFDTRPRISYVSMSQLPCVYGFNCRGRRHS